jgi:uncharacterized protein (TIGR03086 family)
MDILELHDRALDDTERLARGVRQDQMGLPTPCTEWDVRTLLDHLVGGNWRYVAVAEGKSGPPEGGPAPKDLLGDDPAGAYHRSADALKRAWREPGRLEQLVELPFGKMPGRAAVTTHLVETVTHGWDLARATGQEPAYDPAVVEAASQAAHAALGGERPPELPFGPAVEVGADAPAVDRFAAFMGRHP